ncbi:MAG: SCO family protein [Minwuia sp.]|nr:SCO family protein [Minwuia sp.]
MKRSRIFGITVLILALLIGGAAVIIDGLRDPGQRSVASRTSGTIAIGGPYELTSHTGERMSNASFLGTHQLIYFGYTFCPDVCPTELQDMAAVMDELGEAAAQVTPVFITIDPDRDDPEQMAAYVEAFHPRMVGLTGTEQEIATAAKAYRVYYARAPDAKADDPYYLMDHSNFIYFMGPDGQNIDIFNGQMSIEEMASRIGAALPN